MGQYVYDFNEYGEPVGIDYCSDAYEREEAEWEETMHRADDPMYAAHCEAKEWYQRALRAFENEGIEVPDNVVYELSQLMQEKTREEEKNKHFAEMQPYIDFINGLYLGVEAFATADAGGPDEIDIFYIGFDKCLSRNEHKELTEKILKAAEEANLENWEYLEDYLYYY